MLGNRSACIKRTRGGIVLTTTVTLFLRLRSVKFKQEIKQHVWLVRFLVYLKCSYIYMTCFAVGRSLLLEGGEGWGWSYGFIEEKHLKELNLLVQGPPLWWN